MTWFSIRQFRSLVLMLVIVLLADHVQARPADRRVGLDPDEQTESTNGRITGMVVEKAQPLPNHRVELRVQTAVDGLRATQTAATTMTDVRGRFTFTGLGPGIFELVAVLGNKTVKTSAPIQLSAGAMDHTVTLSDSPGVSYSFEDLRAHVEPGARVRVTDTSGKNITGTIVELSSSSLVLMVDGVRRDLAESQVTQIVRRQGSWAGRGALIGLGAGIGLGIAAGSQCSNDPECETAVLLAALATSGAATAAGAAVGWSIKRSQIIFRAPVVPKEAP